MIETPSGASGMSTVQRDTRCAPESCHSMVARASPGHGGPSGGLASSVHSPTSGSSRLSASSAVGWSIASLLPPVGGADGHEPVRVDDLLRDRPELFAFHHHILERLASASCNERTTSAPSPTADATRFVEPLRTSPKNSSSTPLPRSRERPGANHEEENLRMRLRSAWIKREFSIDASDMSKYTL